MGIDVGRGAHVLPLIARARCAADIVDDPRPAVVDIRNVFSGFRIRRNPVIGRDGPGTGVICGECGGIRIRIHAVVGAHVATEEPRRTPDGIAPVERIDPLVRGRVERELADPDGPRSRPRLRIERRLLEQRGAEEAVIEVMEPGHRDRVRRDHERVERVESMVRTDGRPHDRERWTARNRGIVEKMEPAQLVRRQRRTPAEHAILESREIRSRARVRAARCREQRDRSEHGNAPGKVRADARTNRNANRVAIRRGSETEIV